MVEADNQTTTTEAAAEETTQASEGGPAGAQQVQAAEEPFVYPGDNGPLQSNFDRNPALGPRQQPLFAYGNRVRIAGLWKDH